MKLHQCQKICDIKTNTDCDSHLKGVYQRMVVCALVSTLFSWIPCGFHQVKRPFSHIPVLATLVTMLWYFPFFIIISDAFFEMSLDDNLEDGRILLSIHQDIAWVVFKASKLYFEKKLRTYNYDLRTPGRLALEGNV